MRENENQKPIMRPTSTETSRTCMYKCIPIYSRNKPRMNLQQTLMKKLNVDVICECESIQGRGMLVMENCEIHINHDSVYQCESNQLKKRIVTKSVENVVESGRFMAHHLKSTGHFRYQIKPLEN